MSLRSFLDDVGSPDRAIAIVSDETAGPLEGMLADTFAESGVDVSADTDADAAVAVENELAANGETNIAVLLENGTPVASSSMDELYESVLAINSDLFTSGARGLGEIDLPDVLANLAETRLRLRGYPLAHKEKLLLILVSRYIEQTAWQADGGTIRSSFQRLSRLDDEIGTREVYERLAETAVDVHVYGIDPAADATGEGRGGADDVSEAANENAGAVAGGNGGGELPGELDVSVHTGTSDEYQDGWFVVHRPPDPMAPGATPAALVCLETEPRVWDGYWTFDPERVVEIDEYVATEL